MFVDGLDKVKNIAAAADTCIFAINISGIDNLKIKPFFILEPSENGKISIEATRELIKACTLKQTTDTFIIIKAAEAMTLEAQNTLLKLLEEPKENYHFILFTSDPSLLLPTILSRAEIYYQSVKNPLSTPVIASSEIKELAHQLLKTTERDLPDFAENLTKKRKFTRQQVLELLSVTIEISYKSYFATKNPAFLKKLPKLIICYNNISKNGHIKLHLIADF